MSTKPLAHQVMPGAGDAESSSASDGAVRARDSLFHWCGTLEAIQQATTDAEIRALLDSYFGSVAEESIVPVPNTISRYPATYSVAMHELAHVLEAKGMTKPQQARVKQLYAAHQQRDPGDANDTWTDKYGAANEQEYFAQSTNAFFDRNVMDKNHSGRAWLQKNDPDMYAFLVDLYDTQRGADGNAA